MQSSARSGAEVRDPELFDARSMRRAQIAGRAVPPGVPRGRQPARQLRKRGEALLNIGNAGRTAAGAGGGAPESRLLLLKRGAKGSRILVPLGRPVRKALPLVAGQPKLL